MPPFKDESVLIIAPGSQTTAAQLGLPETFTPPRWRFPSRMFPGVEEGQWEPVRIRSKFRRKDVPRINGNGYLAESRDVEMSDVLPSVSSDTVPAQNGTNGATQLDAASIKPEGTEHPSTQTATVVQSETTEEEVFEDDSYSSEGAVYPIVEGRVENWSCFFALLSHVYKMLSPHFHSPLLIVAQPAWSARDKEIITQFVFETWKVPALCIFDSALAACYAYSAQSALVVDIGFDKCDVTAVTDFAVNDQGRAVAVKNAGGRSMTRRLQQTLATKGFDEPMAEHLKKSVVCEILPQGTPMPSQQSNGAAPNPAAAASTGALDSGANAKDADGQRPGQEPRGPGAGTDVGEENEDDNEGVLDVAAIVAQNNAAELLAKREADKAAKLAAKKGAADAPRQARLKNSEKEKANFSYEEHVSADHLGATDGSVGNKRKREVEVGVERFMAATPLKGQVDGILEIIASAIHRTALAVVEPPARSGLWENLIILGNGARMKGFTPALLATLAARYTLSPSTATIFTSELPSNFTTPVATPGTNTPNPGHPPHPMSHPASHGVNPLLVAATRNVMQPHASQHHLQVPGTHTPIPDSGAQSSHHRGFSQSPTTIKTAKIPEYFPEWKDPAVAGMEEAAFLGAQVAAKVVFITDQGISKGFMTRTEYNELGPSGIHECAM